MEVVSDRFRDGIMVGHATALLGDFLSMVDAHKFSSRGPLWKLCPTVHCDDDVSRHGLPR